MITKKTKSYGCTNVKDAVQTGMDMMTSIHNFNRRKKKVKGTGRRLLELRTAEDVEPTTIDIVGLRTLSKKRPRLMPRNIEPSIDYRSLGPNVIPVGIRSEEGEILDQSVLGPLIPSMVQRNIICPKCFTGNPINYDFCERCGAPITPKGSEMLKQRLERQKSLVKNYKSRQHLKAVTNIVVIPFTTKKPIFVNWSHKIGKWVEKGRNMIQFKNVAGLKNYYEKAYGTINMYWE